MFTDLLSINYSIGGGLSIDIVKSTRTRLKKLKTLLRMLSTHVLLR